jgi:nitrate/nitrite transporter NarK
MSNIKKYSILLLLGYCSASTYVLVYIRYYYYDAWVAALGATNTQAGLLYSIYAIGCTISYLPGGLLADRLSIKRNLSLALVLTAGLNFLFAYNSSYYVGVFIWFSLALTTGFIFWACLIKAVRLCGQPNEQGKMFGFWGAFEGLCSSAILAVGMWLFTKFGEAELGLKYATISQGFFCLLAALLVVIFYKDPPKGSNLYIENDSIRLSALVPILKDKKVWFLAILVFCTYNLFNSLSYITPYLTSQFDLTGSESGTLAIVRIQVCAFLFGPIGGLLADKLKSPAKVLFSGHVIMIFFLILLIFIPISAEHSSKAIFVTFLMSAAIYTFYPIMFSVIEEIGFVRAITGTVVGVVTAVGYSPDLFYSPIYGHLLDTYGGQGFTYIFMTMIGNCIMGAVAAYLILRQRKSTKFVYVSPA